MYLKLLLFSLITHEWGRHCLESEICQPLEVKRGEGIVSL